MLKRNQQAGLTLVETVLTVVIVAIIAGGLTEAFVRATKVYLAVDNRKVSLQGVRWAVDRMGREMRLVSRNGVSVANASTVTYMDVHGSTITFLHDTTARQIKRNSGGNSNVLATDVNTLSFAYRDKLDNLVTCPPDCTTIWRIQIQASTRAGGELVSLWTEVHPRNFM